MTKAAEVTEVIHQLTLGGPGLDGYAYNADVYCVPCGIAIIEDVVRDAAMPGLFVDETDTDSIPQPIFFGEADSAQHCAACESYLYGEDSDND